jgi:thioredoxin 1
MLNNTEDEADKEIQEINRRKTEELLRARQQRHKLQSIATPVALTNSSFLREIQGHELTVVDFWAPWCGPCRMLAPIIEELARDYSGKVFFGKLNVDENPLTSNMFQVKSIPTILIFKDGKAVDGIIGVVPRSQIESKLKLFMAQN